MKYILVSLFSVFIVFPINVIKFQIFSFLFIVHGFMVLTKSALKNKPSPTDYRQIEKTDLVFTSKGNLLVNNPPPHPLKGKEEKTGN